MSDLLFACLGSLTSAEAGHDGADGRPSSARCPKSLHRTPVTEGTTHPRKLLLASSPTHYAPRMTTLPKTLLITVVLSALALAQGAPNRTQAKPASASAPSASHNGKGQKDAAAKGPHSNSMPGNHKDVMGGAADKNQGSGSHTGNMTGNHKDVMESTAPAPSSGGKTQPAPAAPASAPNKLRK